MARKKNPNRTFVLTAVIGSLLIMAMVTAGSVWLSRQTGVATDEAVSSVSSFYLEAMADRRAKTISNLINNSFELMGKAVAYIDDEGADSQETLRDAIGKVESLLGLSRFALVDEDNIVYTHYTTYTGGSRHAFLSEAEITGRTISTVSIYGSSKQLCLTIPTPGLTILNKPFKACFVQLGIKDIVDLLALDDQGKTHFALYSPKGGNLSGTELGPVISRHNLFDAIRTFVPQEVLREKREDFENKREGTLSFASDGMEETLVHVPIQGTDWEMAVLIREGVIQDQIRDISEKALAHSRNQIIFTTVSVLALAIVLLFQYHRLSRDKLKAEKETSMAFHNMANTDSLTGIRNKHAYAENEAIINQQIRSGTIEKLAVVIGDINGLKYVNDTMGHSAGDRLIKDASDMICGAFSHGAVFRIGGDEFVVLLRGEGFDTMHEVIGALNRKVEANIKADKVVVSIGYAVLTPQDRQLSDVFARADNMMYERKKALKQMGAKTRDA